jgi:hypothetical protein
VLSVDCSEFGVSDVDGAAQLAERILNYRHGGFNAKLSLYQLPWRARMRKCAKVLALGDRPVLFT